MFQHRHRELPAKALICAASVMLLAWYFSSVYAMTVRLDGNTTTVVLPQDDAYITLNYARTLASGGGIRWHPGADRVEGFSSFLWVIIASAFYSLTSNPLPHLIWFCGLLHVMSIWAFCRILSNFSLPWTMIAPLALVMTFWQPYRHQVLSANEFPLLLACFLLCVLAAMRRSSHIGSDISVGVTAGLLPMIRPEGAILAFVILAFRTERMLCMSPVPISTRSALRRIAMSTSIALIPLLALTVFRLWYFGDPLPNTYYLKMADRPDRIWWGLRDLYGFLLNLPGVLFALPAALLGLRSKIPGAKSISIGFFVTLIGVVYMGGDAWPGWRFYGPAIALFCIAVGLAAKEIHEHSSPPHSAVLALTVWTVFAAMMPALYREYSSQGGFFPQPASAILEFSQTGHSIKSACTAEAVIAVFPAGAVPYYAETAAIDMLGKTDRHIAKQRPLEAALPPGHDKVDFEYVIEQKPDLIVANPFRVSANPGELDRLKDRSFGRYLFEFYSNPSLFSDYEPASLDNGSLVFMKRGSTACTLTSLGRHANLD